jgi:hypothetical protein
MDARNRLLSPRDIFKIWCRKWLRLAPVYYSMWLVVWSMTSRLSDGPLWWFAQMNTATCDGNWIPTVFMAGNLYNPGNMDPYAGCYQMAWPLQLDMQIAVFIPFLAMIMWWRQSVGCLICALFILAEVVINMLLTKHYELTIGLVDAGNYFLLQAIISKPWTKLANVGAAGICACIYNNLLRYRLQGDQAQYPRVHAFKNNKKAGLILAGVSFAVIATCLALAWGANIDPASASPLQNQLYFGLTRPLFVISIGCILMCILFGHLDLLRIALSGSNVRLIGRSLIVACVVEVLVIEVLFCGKAMPQGLYVTLPVGIAALGGFVFVVMFFSVVIMMVFEFPMIRIQ